MAERKRVIVIDDDEVVLVAISDLLEEAGCEVFTQTSPIGATQVILREGIQAAIIDVNLPAIQGDNVVRLLRSWDKIKDLPIVIVSGAPREKLAAIQNELPGVRIVRKEDMQHALVNTLLELLAGNARTGRGSKPQANNKAALSKPHLDELAQRVAVDLAAATPLIRQVWAEARKGHLERVAPLTATLTRLRGQAQLLGRERVASLTQSVCEALWARRVGRPVSPDLDQSVERAIEALAALKASPNGDFAFSPDPLIRSLKQAIGEAPP